MCKAHHCIEPFIIIHLSSQYNLNNVEEGIKPNHQHLFSCCDSCCLIITGAMLGLNMATNSLIRTVSPTVGGVMLGKYGFSSFGYFGFLASGIVTAVLFFKLRDKS